MPKGWQRLAAGPKIALIAVAFAAAGGARAPRARAAEPADAFDDPKLARELPPTPPITRVPSPPVVVAPAKPSAPAAPPAAVPAPAPKAPAAAALPRPAPPSPPAVVAAPAPKPAAAPARPAPAPTPAAHAVVAEHPSPPPAVAPVKTPTAPGPLVPPAQATAPAAAVVPTSPAPVAVSPPPAPLPASAPPPVVPLPSATVAAPAPAAPSAAPVAALAAPVSESTPAPAPEAASHPTATADLTAKARPPEPAAAAPSGPWPYHPRLKLAYRWFSFSRMPASGSSGATASETFQSLSLDAYPTSTYLRVGFSSQFGWESGQFQRTGDYFLAESVSTGFQLPGRFTPFVEGLAGAGYMRRMQAGSSSPTAYWQLGIDAGVEVYFAKRAYVSVALGFLRPGNLFLQQKNLSGIDADTWSLKFGVGI